MTSQAGGQITRHPAGDRTSGQANYLPLQTYSPATKVKLEENLLVTVIKSRFKLPIDDVIRAKRRLISYPSGYLVFEF